MVEKSDAWIFAYGSLMWDPRFDYLDVQPALLRGYHKAFCIRSVSAWGTNERPGLVLGLLPGGSCRGLAFRVAMNQTATVLNRLRRREAAYIHRLVPVAISKRKVEAHIYVANLNHERFVGELPAEDVAQLIRQGIGHSGSSREYLKNSVRYLVEFGIRDEPLHHLLELVDGMGR